MCGSAWQHFYDRTLARRQPVAFDVLGSDVTLTVDRSAVDEYFDKAMWPAERPARIAWETIPSDCAERIRQTRLELDLTLGEFAIRVGAASKAVVSHWESGKRCPWSVFWQRIQGLRPTNGARQTFATAKN